MLGWLYRVIVGRFKLCNHKWEIIRQGVIRNEIDSIPDGHYYYLQCKNCGEIKEVKFK